VLRSTGRLTQARKTSPTTLRAVEQELLEDRWPGARRKGLIRRSTSAGLAASLSLRLTLLPPGIDRPTFCILEKTCFDPRWPPPLFWLARFHPVRGQTPKEPTDPGIPAPKPRWSHAESV